MKKKFLWVSVSALSFGVVGCGVSNSANNANSSGTTSITVEMEQGNPPSTTKKFLNQVVVGFEKKYPNIKVNIETYPGSPANLVDTMVASHQGPNVLEIGTTFIPTLAFSKAFVPWTQEMQNKVVPSLIPTATKMDGIPGQLPIGIPDSASPFVLWYNKKLFQQSGISSPPKTWTEFIQDAKKINDPAKGVYGAAIASADPFYSMHVTWLLSRQLGGEVINSAGTQAQFSSPPVYKAVQFYVDWLKKYHIVSPADVQYQEADMINAFMQGKIGMIPVGGIYDLTTLKADPQFVNNDLGVAPNPTIPYGMTSTPPGGLPTESFLSGQEQVIFKYSTPAQISASEKWIQYYTSPQIQANMWKEYGDLPVNINSFKLVPELQSPMWKAFLSIENHSNPTPLVSGWLQLPTVYDKALSTVFDDIALNHYTTGQLSQTLKSVDSQIDNTLAQLKG